MLSAFVPISTDLYLPALPIMAENLNTTEAMMNLTMIGFFVAYAIVSLIWGPFSDKYGRRIILIIGVIIYTAGSILCALAGDITWLIIFRLIQAVGGGTTFTLATAITRDVYDGRKQESILAIVQSLTMIVPVVAPLIGAFLLNFTNWRGMFWIQAVLGLVVTIFALLFKETLKEKGESNIIGTLARLVVVMKNPRFAVLVPIFQLVPIGVMSFVASSSYIYQNYFGLSSQVYSYYFLINALGMMLGPMLYIYFSRFIDRDKIITFSFIILLLSGILILLFGAKGPWILSFTMLPASIFGGVTRPPGTFLMLSQQKSDTGSAASINVFFGTIFASVGMSLSTALPFNMITTIGLLFTVISIFSGILWIALKKGYK